MKKHWKLILVLAVVVVVVGAAGVLAAFVYAIGNKPQFRTATVERGDLTGTITATGTLQAEETIDIGAQVAGMIDKLGEDPKNPSKTVDYCTDVEQGTVLARIDPALYAAVVAKAKADKGQAEASVDQAKATLEAMKSKLTQTKRDWERVKDLRSKGVLSDFDIDTAQNAFEAAQAAIPGGEAAIKQATRAVDTADAVLKQAEINLGYCTIKSPRKGVIIDRRVNVGQTVVSSLNAPSLFLLAADLTKIQIWASVNEADIGRIRNGQKVTFTVDAYPKDTFKGTVTQVRLNATSTQQVVTYTVVVTTDNPATPEYPNGKLKPYMTANLQFIVATREKVLMVPTAALRWRPQQLQQVAPEARAAYAKSSTKRGAKPPAGTGQEKDQTERGTVWVLENGYVRPVRVEIDVTDGTNTEIIDKEGLLPEHTVVVIGGVQQDSGGGGTTNPFAAQPFGPKKQ